MARNPALATVTDADIDAERDARGLAFIYVCECFADDEDPFDGEALNEARALLALGNLGEAVIWIGRAHPHLSRLPDLVARAFDREA